MSSRSPKNLVFTNSFNAAAIARGLAALGISLESTAKPPGLVPYSGRPPLPGDMLFFTDERDLASYLGNDGFRMLPRGGSLIIDDKLALSQWLEQQGEKPVPFAPLTNNTPPFPVVLKARHSWRGIRQLPRGYVCGTRSELASAVQSLGLRQLSREWFFLQQFIGGDAHVYSTCGFFDCRSPRRTAVLTVRRLLSMGGDLQSSAIVETIPDPAGLTARTEAILSAMNYTGPFELEFLRSDDGEYFVLEMNPRFWLQHGLFIDYYDNLLLRRYVNPADETPFCSPSVGDQPIVWLNSWAFLQAVLRSNGKMLAAFYAQVARWRRGEIRAGWYPNWPQAMSWLAHTPYRRLTRTYRRTFSEAQPRRAA